MNQYQFKGKLVFNDKAQFEIHNIVKNEVVESVNLTNILDRIYEGTKQYIEIQICGLLYEIYNEKGILYKANDGCGCLSYMINGKGLDKALFNHTDELVTINITTNTKVNVEMES